MQTSKRQPGRPRSRATLTGDGKQLPRSFGMVLEAVRNELDLNLDEMHAVLRMTPSTYELPKGKSHEKVMSGQTVSNWERARRSVPFSIEHRYGTLSGTWNGVLYVVSLLYVFLRDASNPKDTRNDPQPNLEAMRNLGIELVRLGNKAQRMANAFQKSGLALNLRGDLSERTVRQRHLSVIKELLDAYRNDVPVPVPTAADLIEKLRQGRQTSR